MTEKRKTKRPKLVRPLIDREIAGVCSGLAHRYGWNVTRVRVLFMLAGILGIGIVVYVALWIASPNEDIREEIEETPNAGLQNTPAGDVSLQEYGFAAERGPRDGG